MGGISIWQLLIVLAIVLIIFGTKRFRNIGTDLGGAIKGFKKSMNDETDKTTQTKIIDSEVVSEEEKTK